MGQNGEKSLFSPLNGWRNIRIPVGDGLLSASQMGRSNAVHACHTDRRCEDHVQETDRRATPKIVRTDTTASQLRYVHTPDVSIAETYPNANPPPIDDCVTTG